MTEPKPKSWHDLSDPVTIAAVIVRDHLDTAIHRHGQGKGDAVSAAVLQLATALLEHLPGEAKYARSVRPDVVPAPIHAASNREDLK